MLLLLVGCAHRVPPPPILAAMPAPAAAAVPVLPEQPAWVGLGPVPTVRTLVAHDAGCPALDVDGHAVPMHLRVAAGTAAPRPGEGMPASFPLDVCEAALPASARALHLGDRALPPVAAEPRRIVVLGDTGCRLLGAASQGCNKPEEWPFAEVARTAAAMHPDLVIHVGDYHYRETPCPLANDGCAGSPWGYGWDAWNADFFAPARPLLAAAPWVFVRGNHEECERAGQGWFRLLAPEPWTPQRSCQRPEDDGDGDFSPPYAVPLGATTQVLVFDSAHAGNRPLDLGKPGNLAIHDHYAAEVRALDALATPGRRNWFASHHPVLGFAPDDHPGATHPYPGNAPLQQALAGLNGTVYFPPGVQAALHGHVHLFQALGFDDGHPATLVAGNGGDLSDAPLPDPLPPGSNPAPGVHLAQATYSDLFGFLLMERTDDDGRWTITAYRRNGAVLTRCDMTPDGRLACTPRGWLHD